MAIKKIIAVRDQKTATYEAVHLVNHIGDAIRGWDTVRKDEATKYGKYPQDFDLYHIGDFEEETGLIQSLQPHTHLATGV